MSALAVLLRCPQCSSRKIEDVTPAQEERGWWAAMHCRECDHRWRARS